LDVTAGIRYVVYVLCIFLQEADDNDYQTEDSASDITDSDIDLDEHDEVKSDTEEAGDGKRKRRLVTKAYKVSCTTIKCELCRSNANETQFL